MRTEYTRQTRWAAEPETVDEIAAPGNPYVRQCTWAACPDCDLQVHAMVSQSIASGINCPECGKRLTSPRVMGNPDVAAARIQDAEELLAAGLDPSLALDPAV